MSSRPLFWSLVQQIGRQLAGYGVFVALAALLPPKDFGVLGVATAWLAFMAVFSELGFSVALIQKADITSSHYSSTFYLNIVMGAVLCLLGAALAHPAASLLGIPESGPVIMVLSAGFLINGFSLTQAAVAQKAMRFKDLAKRDILASLGGGLVGIVLAWQGFGIWSLVAQTLAGNVFGALLLWRFSDFRPRLGEVSFERIKELWGYSSSMFLYNFFKFVVQNADRLLVGFFLGAESVGLYTFANKIILTPAAAVRGAIGSYLFPLFARLQADPGKVKQAYFDINKGINLVLVPGLLLAGALIPVLVPAAFGGKWDKAIPLIQILTMVGAMQFLIAPVGEMMKAMGRPKWLLTWSVGFSAVSTSLLALGCRWDITVVGWGFALAHAIVLPINFWLAGRMIPLTLSDCIRMVWPFPVFALPVLGLALAGHFSHASKPSLIHAGWTFTAMMLAAAAMVYSQRTFLASLRNRQVLGGKPEAAAPAPAVPT